MTHILDSSDIDITDVENPNHPCAGKNCNECESCIFDQDLFLDKNQNKKDMDVCASCHLCLICWPQVPPTLRGGRHEDVPIRKQGPWGTC